jgi:hypothetical protein
MWMGGGGKWMGSGLSKRRVMDDLHDRIVWSGVFMVFGI